MSEPVNPHDFIATMLDPALRNEMKRKAVLEDYASIKAMQGVMLARFLAAQPWTQSGFAFVPASRAGKRYNVHAAPDVIAAAVQVAAQLRVSPAAFAATAVRWWLHG